MVKELTRLVDQLRETELWRRAAQYAAGFKGAGDEAAVREPRIEFEVIEGVHSGAKLEFTESTFTIGSSVDSEIVLSDPDIAETHARLRVTANRVYLEAIGGPITLGDGQVLPEGYGRKCRLPVEAVVGEARIRLVGLEGPQPTPIPLSNRTLLIAAGLIATVFAVPVASNTLSRSGPDQAATGGSWMLASTQATRPLEAPAEEQARSALMHQLERAGIGDLDVTAAEGRLMVSGTVPERQAEAWQSVQAWFDERHAGRLLLISNVMVGGSSQAPRLPLQAIWYGERPYVITTDGARYHEGAFVSGGWIIKEIGEEQLLLAKDNTVMALKYQ
ncbi:SctD/MshK family protein [Chelativorans alearense]|uniref:SctD/MshK family protein n=1 Tax=Chelativorans alearense TaxID=2681495 RepID=UPI0013CF7A15|nr:FHA domain-containing protein [Chelativorans alearense]